MSNHAVLLGDSIFDNKAYVGGGPAVVEQVAAQLPPGWRATLLAIDGSVCADVPRQLRRLPADASHLVVSAGGNDALAASGVLARPADSAAEVFGLLAEIRERFARAYETMLTEVLAAGRPTAVCTVYDPNYDDRRHQRLAAGLAVFNDAITRAAARHGLPLLDLRVAFRSRAEYANPIEPSVAGGEVIARLVREVVTSHDFSRRRTAIFA